MEKACSQCGETKPVTAFYKYKLGVYGRRAACKKCCYERYGEMWRTKARQWGRDNRERNIKRARDWEAADPKRREAGFKRLADFAKKNPDRMRTVNIYHNRSRFARKRKAQPVWASKFIMSEFYDASRLRTLHTGIKWNVDHIVPLRSKIVCGLHVEHNMRVIPAYENNKKSNRLWPDMPS